MHQPPRATSGGPSWSVARLVLTAVLAGAGGVILLAGLGSFASPAPAGTASPAAAAAASSTSEPPTARPANPVASATPPPSPPGDPVLVGAGDIGRCDVESDEATAALVERLPGIVFTLGDNVYEVGAPSEFRNCFAPSWGQFRDRILLPVPGNHDHETEDALGYRAYFGAAAVEEGRTWYSRDVGQWHVVVLDFDLRQGRRRLRPGLAAARVAARRPCAQRGTVHARAVPPSPVQQR